MRSQRLLGPDNPLSHREQVSAATRWKHPAGTQHICGACSGVRSVAHRESARPLALLCALTVRKRRLFGSAGSGCDVEQGRWCCGLGRCRCLRGV